MESLLSIPGGNQGITRLLAARIAQAIQRKQALDKTNHHV